MFFYSVLLTVVISLQCYNWGSNSCVCFFKSQYHWSSFSWFYFNKSLSSNILSIDYSYCSTLNFFWLIWNKSISTLFNCYSLAYNLFIWTSLPMILHLRDSNSYTIDSSLVSNSNFSTSCLSCYNLSHANSIIICSILL
jgi:hypothetical protein